MTFGAEFPRLTPQNHRLSSQPTPQYNCIAWTAGDTEHWWQPGVYWPIDAPADEYGIGILERAFSALGFEDCERSDLEDGFEKIALYGNSLYYSHAARQLADGTWTSKLGRTEDIEHETPEDVAGGLYGEVVQFMKRPIQGVR